jgi:type II secretory pathway pseudopilin PulG
MNLGNKSIQKTLWLKAPTDVSRAAFTRTDLFLVILLLALLALVVLPALAGVQNKGGRADCANNLRQIGQDSMIYAGENNGWLPVCTLGGANGEGSRTNHLGGEHYTRYVYIGGTPNTQLTTNEPPISGGGYQNLGYLYQAGLAGTGSIFYCPALWGTAAGASYYTPLLTEDSTGVVRSSYIYNPRVVNPNIFPPIRRYQKTSDLEPHKLFAMDYMFASSGTVGISANSIEHIRDRGWNVLFTDGSVQFARPSPYVYTLIVNNLSDAETVASFQGYDQVFNWLEQDH